MLVVDLDLTEFNFVVAAEQRYFVLERSGRTFLVRDACPHRGGPLHLARRLDAEDKLVCPWHGVATPLRMVLATAAALVRVGTHAAAVLDHPPDSRLWLRRTTVTASTSVSAAGGQPRAPSR